MEEYFMDGSICECGKELKFNDFVYNCECGKVYRQIEDSKFYMLIVNSKKLLQE